MPFFADWFVWWNNHCSIHYKIPFKTINKKQKDLSFSFWIEIKTKNNFSKFEKISLNEIQLIVWKWIQFTFISIFLNFIFFKCSKWRCNLFFFLLKKEWGRNSIELNWAPFEISPFECNQFHLFSQSFLWLENFCFIFFFLIYYFFFCYYFCNQKMLQMFSIDYSKTPIEMHSILNYKIDDLFSFFVFCLKIFFVESQKWWMWKLEMHWKLMLGK